MDYKKIYKQLCERGKNRKLEKMYVEKHHIIPTFFFKNPKRKLRYYDGIYEGNGEHQSNITYLTPREHFLAHYLLHKIFYGTKWSYRCSSSLMLFFVKTNGKHVRSNNFSPSVFKKYENIHSEIRKIQSEAMKGKIIVKDKDTKELIGKVSVDHPNVLSGQWVHHSKGVKVPESRLKRYSELATGENNSNFKHIEMEWIYEAVRYVTENYKDDDRYFVKQGNKVYILRNIIEKRMAEYINIKYLGDKRIPISKVPSMYNKDIAGIFNKVYKTDIFTYNRYFRGWKRGNNVKD